MKRQYLRTERAHFMCPCMHFGILMEMDKAFDRAEADAVIGRMAAAHPFLRSLIACEEGTDALYYRVTESSRIITCLKEDTASLWDDYKEISLQDWNVFKEGLLKIYFYPGRQDMKILFIAHHLLTDGRGLLDLAREFAADYTAGIHPEPAEEVLMESIEDLPWGSRLSGVNALIAGLAGSMWEREGRRVSYEEFLRFAREYGRTHPLKYQTFEADEKKVEEMARLCRDSGFTMNDLLMAHTYIRTGTEKIIIAADIRKEFSGYRKGALGNYSTAMGIICRSRTKDVVRKAREVHRLVRRHMKRARDRMLVLAFYFELPPSLLDAAAISGLGGFESRAGDLVGRFMMGYGRPGGCSITNLGRTESPHIRSLMFIPPASPAVKLTLGVVTLNGRMKICAVSSV